MLRCSVLLIITSAGVLISDWVADVKGVEIVMQELLTLGNGALTKGQLNCSHIHHTSCMGSVRSACQICVSAATLGR